MKRLLSVVLLASLVLLTGCTGSEEAEKIQIGILQPLEHSALEEARLGFIDELAENGFGEDEVEYTYLNAMASDTDLKTFASDLIRSCDLVLGIGTGASQALQSAAANINSDVPILFTAVTDPVGAGLVSSMELVGENIAGTTDLNPVDQQIDIIEEVLGDDVSTIGICYSAAEQNSEVQANIAKSAIEAAGITCEIGTINSASEIAITIRNLCKTCDAIYIPTDNTMAANMSLVAQVANEENVLIVTGAASMVNDGGHITVALDYYELGTLTGTMAADVLNGADISQMSVESLDSKDCALTINQTNLDIIGVTLPTSILDRLN